MRDSGFLSLLSFKNDTVLDEKHSLTFFIHIKNLGVISIFLNVVHIHNGGLFSCKECNCAICKKMDGTGGHHIKKNKPDSERKILHIFTNVEAIKKDDIKIEGNYY